MKYLKTCLVMICCMFSVMLFGCENQNLTSLSTPANVSVENGIIKFDAVQDADYYAISVNDKVFMVDAKYNSNVKIVDSVINYDANKILTYGKSYSIKVKARGENKYDSHYSNAIEYLHNVDLNMPKNVSLSAKTLIWDSVDNADYYIVKITYVTDSRVEEVRSDVCYCDISSVVQMCGTGEYNLQVKAVRAIVSPAESVYSESVKYLHYQQLDVPVINSVYMSGSDLKMNATIDENANKLTVYCDDDFRSVMLNGSSEYVTISASRVTINLTGLFGVSQFEQLKKYVFTLQAKHESSSVSYFLNSEKSSQFVFNKTEKLQTPNLSLQYNHDLNSYVVSWNSVDNACGYKLIVDDSTEYLVEKTKTMFLITDSFSSVKLKALGVGNFEDSDYSNVVTK